MKKRNFMKGYSAYPTKHAIERYAERTDVSFEEAKTTIVHKFKNSKLMKFLDDGLELRREYDGPMDSKLNFIAAKYGKRYVIITCFLQGSKRDWWKNEGIQEVN